MTRLMLAALVALAVMASCLTPAAPVQAQAGFFAGGPVGVVWHAQVVNRCKHRQLTGEEARRTFIFPVLSVLRAYGDCHEIKSNQNKKKPRPVLRQGDCSLSQETLAALRGQEMPEKAQAKQAAPRTAAAPCLPLS